MAQKRTYIYHLLIGQDENVQIDCFMYARNAGVAVDFCKELYRDKKYNSYRAIKVGIAHTLQDTKILDKEEEAQLRKSGADNGEKFKERDLPPLTYIPKEKAEELGL